MANFLSREKRIQVLKCLVEGVSIRGTCRLTGVQKNTILRLLVEAGEGCAALHDQFVRGMVVKILQVDEIWGFVHTKQKRLSDEDKVHGRRGSQYTFVAMDPDTKLVISYVTGKRTEVTTRRFTADLASRLVLDEKTPIQLTSDGFEPYVAAIEDELGLYVAYGMLVKQYTEKPKRYVGAKKTSIIGKPDRKKISTSLIERQNLTMRMGMRRMTRKTNGFSKKLKNLRAAMALHFAHYNFCRIHMTLRVTPAMEAGLTRHLWGIPELLDAVSGTRLESAEAA